MDGPTRNIVYLASARLPSRAANTVHVMKICAAMASLGHCVSLLTSSYSGDPGIFEHYGVPRSFTVEGADSPVFRRQLLTGLRMALRARRMGADLVWGRHLTGCFFSALLGLKVVYETHDDSSALNRLGRLLVRCMFAIRSVRRVVVISDALAQIYARGWPGAGAKLLVAHDGADPSPPGEGWSLAEEPRGFKVGYIGHLYRGRGIELIAELARRCPWATFYLLGGSPEDLERWRTETAGMANLRFLGFLPPGEVERARCGFDALVAPYQRKVAVSGNRGNTADWMSPLKIFEYMASGRPMVASDLPALREILVPGETALLCDPESPDEWEAALLRLRDDGDLRRRLGERARETLLAEHTWKARARKVLAEAL